MDTHAEVQIPAGGDNKFKAKYEVHSRVFLCQKQLSYLDNMHLYVNV